MVDEMNEGKWEYCEKAEMECERVGKASHEECTLCLLTEILREVRGEEDLEEDSK